LADLFKDSQIVVRVGNAYMTAVIVGIGLTQQLSLSWGIELRVIWFY